MALLSRARTGWRDAEGNASWSERPTRWISNSRSGMWTARFATPPKLPSRRAAVARPRPPAALRGRDRGRVLGRDRRAVRGRGAGLGRADLPGRRPPLRARARRGTRPRRLAPVRGQARRRARVAIARLGLPTQRLPHLPEGRAAAGGVRLVPGERAPGAPLDTHLRPVGQEHRGRRAVRTGAAHADPTAGALARPPAPPRRPGLRGRGLAEDARVHALEARPLTATRAVRGRLRGVRPPLQRVLVRADHPLALVHGVLGDGLRRPRRAR